MSLLKRPRWKLRQSLNYLIRRPALSPVRFVIFGRGRSGSTALVSLLDGVRGIHCDGEILSQPVLLPRPYLYSQCARSQASVYGCKVLSYQIRDVQPLWQRQQFLHYLTAAGFKIIYLRRVNLFHHALSNIQARVGGFHRRATETGQPPAAITVAPELLLDWMRRSEELARFEQRLLQGVTALSLTYEEHLRYSPQHQSTVDTICDFLGVPSSPVASAYAKLLPQRWQDAIANSQEIIDYFSHTPYAPYLIADSSAQDRSPPPELE